MIGKIHRSRFPCLGKVAVVVGWLALGGLAWAQSGTAPTINPAGPVYVTVDASAKQTFTASGGDAPEPQTSPPCPPWIKKGAPRYVWSYATLQGTPASGAAGGTLQMNRDQTGSTTIKVKLKQDWEDSGTPPQASETTESPDSTGVQYAVLKVEITPPSDIATEGADSETFEAVVTPSGLSGLAYQWTWESPSGAGNNPSVNFSNPTDFQTRVLNSHWYALPNDICDAELASDYTITCTVSPNGQELCVASATLSVRLRTQAGETTPPSIQGFPNIAFDPSNNVYKVSGVGSLTRTLANVQILLDANSEFRTKAEAHENQHKQDYDNGFRGHEFYTVAEFFDQIDDLTDPSQTNLVAKIQAKANQYRQNEDQDILSVFDCLEVSAYQASDPVAPQYKYHNCGQYTCP
jgi:hypothetical protein